MNSNFTTVNDITSIRGGGKAGELIRATNWTDTTLGDPGEWPKELFTSLGILLNSPIPMVLLWGNDLVCFCNDSFISSPCARTTQQVIGRKLMDIMPDVWLRVKKSIEKVLRTGESVLQEDRRYSFSPVFGEEGNISGVFAVCMEYGQKVNPVEKVPESEEQIRNLICNISSGIVVLKGENLRIAIVNEAYAKLIGQNKEDIFDKPLFDVIPKAEPFFKEIIENVRNSGNSYYQNDHPFCVYKKSIKTEGYLDLAYHPYKDDNGEVTGVIVLCHDVTQQVRTRKNSEHIALIRSKQLDNAHQELLRYNNELEQLAYITSHDFQEPARKITVFIDLLERSLENSNEQCRTYIEKIKKSSLRTLALIKDVLSYSQLSMRADKVSTVDLQQVIENSVSDLQELIEEKNAKIIYVDMPVIDAVPEQMQQLFGHLLSNALKFTYKDVAPLVNITCYPLTKDEIRLNNLDLNNRYYHIQVKDNGIGFNEESADRIFNICHRLHSKEEFDGTGVGLAICKKIISNHLGRIFASSKHGRGTTIHLLIPHLQLR